MNRPSSSSSNSNVISGISPSPLNNGNGQVTQRMLHEQSQVVNFLQHSFYNPDMAAIQQHQLLLGMAPNQASLFNSIDLATGAKVRFEHQPFMAQVQSSSGTQMHQIQHDPSMGVYSMYPSLRNVDHQQKLAEHQIILSHATDLSQNSVQHQQVNAGFLNTMKHFDDANGSTSVNILGNAVAPQVEPADLTAVTTAPVTNKRRKSRERDSGKTIDQMNFKDTRAARSETTTEANPSSQSKLLAVELSTSGAAAINDFMEVQNECFEIKSKASHEHTADAFEDNSTDSNHQIQCHHATTSVQPISDLHLKTAQDKAQSHRDRNREHARSTRLRKKEYVIKLKELVDSLHAERTEDARKQRVAMQLLAETQCIKRKAVNTFLTYHAKYQSDVNKWKTILEEEFWMKQPVTPYRSFRRSEIQKGSRILKGVNAIIEDAASMSVMIETIGSQNIRWLQRKRDDFLTRLHSTHAYPDISKPIPQSIARQSSSFQHAVSSVSSSTGSCTNGSINEDEHRLADKQLDQQAKDHLVKVKSGSRYNDPKQVSVSTTSTDSTWQKPQCSNDFHDYDAPSLPDPLLESDGSSPDSNTPDGGDSDSFLLGKHSCTESYLDEEGKMVIDSNSQKRVKVIKLSSTLCDERTPKLNINDASCGKIQKSTITSLPLNIARSGGISHNVKVTTTQLHTASRNGHAQLSRAPAVALPPFIGIGKKFNGKSTVNDVSSHQINNSRASKSMTMTSDISKSVGNDLHEKNTAMDDSSFNSTARSNIIDSENTSIQAYYHINEDDMIIIDDVLMCPFMFRSQDAVWYGAGTECAMPGMLRACFSSTNRLQSMEMIFDAMGFCQQLERASWNEGLAHIIPNSLEMALVPNSGEARVITLAKEPFSIVSVNEKWTDITGYSQVDAEGKELSILNGKRSVLDSGRRAGYPIHEFTSVAQGRPACSVNVHYHANGEEFLNFMCSYPLSNLTNEITHLLHVCRALPYDS